MTQAEVLMTPEEAPVLTIEDVSIQFGDFKAVKHVSTEVGKRSGSLSDPTVPEKRRFLMLSAEKTV